MAKFRKKPIIVEAGQYLVEKFEPEGLCWELTHGADCPHVHTIHNDWFFSKLCHNLPTFY